MIRCKQQDVEKSAQNDEMSTIKWTIEDMDYGDTVAIAGKWPDGSSLGMMYEYYRGRFTRDECIAHGKAALMEWHGKRKDRQRD